MKCLLVLSFFFFALISVSYGQTADSTAGPKPAGPVYRVVQVMPEFPGGKDSLEAFIKANLKYPRSARENKIEGTVQTEFTVETDGSLSDIKVKKAVSPKLDDEAVRLIKLMPKFKPGKQQGKAVRVIYSVPVTFKMPQ
jgi:protein TonB